MRRPRVFLSYRHQESADDPEVNRAHRAWVHQLAADLEAAGVDVLWDEHVRACLAPYCAIDPNEAPVCQEISRSLTRICDAFAPIVTPAYLERIGVSDGMRTTSFAYGAVLDEWQGAAWLARHGALTVLPIIRSGQAQELNLAPIAPFFQGPFLDFRGAARSVYEARLGQLVERLRQLDPAGNPYPAIALQDWCDAYVAWARVAFPDRAAAPVDIWASDTSASQEFLDALAAEARAAGADSSGERLVVLLTHWKHENEAKARAAARDLEARDVVALMHAALHVQRQEYGWAHLERATRHCLEAETEAGLAGAAEERAKALNNIAQGLQRLAARTGDSADSAQAAAMLRRALDEAAHCDAPAVALRIRANLAEALATAPAAGRAQLLEALSQYRAVAAALAELGEAAPPLRIAEAMAALEARL